MKTEREWEKKNIIILIKCLRDALSSPMCLLQHYLHKYYACLARTKALTLVGKQKHRNATFDAKWTSGDISFASEYRWVADVNVATAAAVTLSKLTIFGRQCLVYLGLVVCVCASSHVNSDEMQTNRCRRRRRKYEKHALTESRVSKLSNFGL